MTNEFLYTLIYHFTLFSIGKWLRQGWKLGWNDYTIWIEKYGYKVKFDGKSMSEQLLIYYIYLNHNTEFSGAATESKSQKSKYKQ